MLTIILFGIFLWVFIIAATPPGTITNNKYTVFFTTGLLFAYMSTLLIVKENTSVDMERYMRDFQSISDYGLLDSIKIFDREPLFVTFQWLIGQISTNTDFFYLAVGIFFSTILLIAFRRIFEPWQVLVIFFSYLNFFLFFPYITNTIRQGFAIAFIILSLFIVLKKGSRFWFLFSIVLAPLFHVTALPLSLILLVINKFKINIKFSVGVWILSALFFVTGFNIFILGAFSDSIPMLKEYTSSSAMQTYAGGVNRLDFLAFSTLGLIVPFFFRKRLEGHQKETYNIIATTYVLFNVYFLLLGFIAFSDRLAAYSWFLIPLLLWYPILKIRKNRITYTLSFLILFIIFSLVTGSELYF